MISVVINYLCIMVIYTVPVIFFFNQKVQDILKDAWNAEGSPFKGQSFDPSKINMGQGGVVTINNQEDPVAKWPSNERQGM